MALIITIFLMLVNISSAERYNGPQSESMTALDVWMLMCMLFVAATLVEYAFMLAIRFGFMTDTKWHFAPHRLRGGKNKAAKSWGVKIARGCDEEALRAKCKKIDRYALFSFLLADGIAVFGFWCSYLSNNEGH